MWGGGVGDDGDRCTRDGGGGWGVMAVLRQRSERVKSQLAISHFSTFNRCFQANFLAFGVISDGGHDGAVG